MPFVSHHDRTLDEKNRIQIPAEFRGQMDARTQGDKFVLCPGDSNTTLSLYPIRTWEAMVARLLNRELPDDRAIDNEKRFHANSSILEMDPQGRVVLPKKHLEMAKLGKEITMAGANHRIDIWNTSEFHEFIYAGQDDWPDRKQFMRMLGSGWKEPNPSSSA